jgi:hypothetical protein
MITLNFKFQVSSYNYKHMKYDSIYSATYYTNWDQYNVLYCIIIYVKLSSLMKNIKEIEDKITQVN